jgi:SAM-dependent methyltransferase
MRHMFGKVYASLYDTFYREKDYDGEVALLRRLFDQYGTAPVRTVLDLGCGTGNHAVRLAAAGYQVVGVDRSQDMLAMAKAKREGHRGRLRFVHGDIQNLTLGETFDAAIMMFAVLSYQVDEADVLSALKTSRRHLGHNGLLVFDVWYGPAVIAQGPEERVRTVEESGTTLTRISSGQLETKRNVCHVEFGLKRRQTNGNLGETKESHVVRYFFKDEILQFLRDSGFNLLRLAAFPAFDREPDETSWNVTAVAITA